LQARENAVHGMLGAAVGIVALLFAVFWHRIRILAGAVGLGLWIYASVAILSLVSIYAYPTTYKRPPTAYQAISVANGKQLYVRSGCQDCHGPAGHGDGPAAAQLDPKPADLTAPHASSHTAGDLFWWISYGMQKSAMPGFAGTLGEDDRWNLIYFLRALADSERVRSLSPIVEGEPWLVAPDFSYGTGTGDTKTLKEYRGNKIILLVLPSRRNLAERLAQLSAASPRLQSAGVEIIVVPDPTDHPGIVYSGLIATEGQAEIIDTFSLFARSLLDDNLVSGSPSTEFLIDRQGYIRARWLPAEGDAWTNADDLLAQIDFLKKEKPGAPAPDWHVH